MSTDKYPSIFLLQLEAIVHLYSTSTQHQNNNLYRECSLSPWCLTFIQQDVGGGQLFPSLHVDSTFGVKTRLTLRV